MPLISEVTHHLALTPLLWLGALSYTGKTIRSEWWLLALVLAVSWIADSAAHFIDPWFVSALYPIAQAVLVAAVVLSPVAAHRFILAILAIAVVSISWNGVGRPDLFIRTICWVGIMLMLWPLGSSIRVIAFSAFGLCWLAWIGYSMSPSWTTWGLYQGVRAATDGAFCWASARA